MDVATATSSLMDGSYWLLHRSADGTELHLPSNLSLDSIIRHLERLLIDGILQHIEQEGKIANS